MKKVITYGTYDLLHRGHVNILKRAKSFGDFLVVGLSTDAFNEQKGKKAFYTYDERKLVLEAIRYVDLVIPEDGWGQKESNIVNYGIHTFVMGDDWQGKFDELKKLCDVRYIPRTKGISTTQIRYSLSLTDSCDVKVID